METHQYAISSPDLPLEKTLCGNTNTINLPLSASVLQVTSFECQKESIPGMWANYGITCSLNMRLEKEETQCGHDNSKSLIPWNLINPSGLQQVR